MATRYLVAMDHVDIHAKKVMRKYAQNRPLGDIERKYQYALPQPILSYHTVINTSATQNYRPKSSANVIQEQRQRIHDLNNRPRNTRSAPATRRVKVHIDDSCSFTDDLYPPPPNINVSIQGRPATSASVSGNKGSVRRSSNLRKRPKTTGHLKKSQPTHEFMVVKVDPDILMSSRRRKELTSQIKEQWNSVNHDLSGGQFVRGSGQSIGLTGLDSPRPCGQWLTFGGSNRSDSHGVVDAFATLSGEGQSYSIDGLSGSRVAQQLQKGGKIRIGVNGSVSVAKETPQEDEQDNISGEKNDVIKPVPLCWTDQISSQDTKVLRPRSPPKETPKPNLCETHPVVFKKLLAMDITRPKLAMTPHSSVGSAACRKPQTTLLNPKPDNEFITGKSGNGSYRNTVITQQESLSEVLPRNEDYNTSVMPVSVRDSKLEDKGSSTDSDPQISGTRSSARSRSSYDKKTSKVNLRRGSQHESGLQNKPLRVKPSPASLQVYTSPDPELSINVSGTKAEINSPKIHSPTPCKKDFPASGKTNIRYSSSASNSVNAQSPQPEFIHFATGLVNPNPQRRSKSAEATSFKATNVTEHTQREVSFDLSTARETSAHTDTKDFDSTKCEVLKRTNTPVSPEPPRDSLTSSPGPGPESFAFSIPTADSEAGDKATRSLFRDKSPSMSEDKTSQSPSMSEDKTSQSPSIWAGQEIHPDPPESNINTQYDPQFDSQFEEITALMRESLKVPNQHSDYSSGNSDSSMSHHSEEQFDHNSRTNSTKQHVRFECDTKSNDSADDHKASVSSTVETPKFGDLLSSSLQPGSLDATVEVRRLRQQIRHDLLKQQEDTEDDIQYLRLRHDKHFT